MSQAEYIDRLVAQGWQWDYVSRILRKPEMGHVECCTSGLGSEYFLVWKRGRDSQPGRYLRNRKGVYFHRFRRLDTAVAALLKTNR